VSIGGALERARRAAGMTVAQVSHQTKIREAVIRGIERDDYAVCGAGFWARGHIRSIARAVGADPELLIQEYDATRMAGQWAGSDDEVTLPDLPAVGWGSRVPGPPAAARTAPDHLAADRDPSEPAAPGLRPGEEAGRAAAAGRRAEARAAAGDLAGSVIAGHPPASAHPPGPPALPPGAEPGAAAGCPAGPRTVSRPAAAPAIEPLSPQVPGSRRWLTRAAMLALVLAAPLTIVAFFARSPARQPAAGKTAAASRPAAPTRRPARIPTLRPVSATDFGIGGPGQGDDPQNAALAIDGNPATAWHTDWYTTAGFGNLYPGTGLLLDMGRTVTIAAVRVRLGAARGTSFQVRVGNIPALAGLRPVARAADAANLVRLRLSTPARGRYVLIWLTRLPPDPAGTFQASIYEITLTGQRQPQRGGAAAVR